MRAAIVVGTILALMAVAWSTVFRQSEGRLPNVEFRTIAGDRIPLETLRGKPVLIAFWASDCLGCIEEIPDLIALHQDYSARGLKIIGVAMPYDPPNLVLAMVKARQLPYPVALDPLGQITAAFGGVNLVPNSFLIGPDGRIARHRLGRLRAEELRPHIERMLATS